MVGCCGLHFHGFSEQVMRGRGLCTTGVGEIRWKPTEKNGGTFLSCGRVREDFFPCSLFFLLTADLGISSARTLEAGGSIQWCMACQEKTWET